MTKEEWEQQAVKDGWQSPTAITVSMPKDPPKSVSGRPMTFYSNGQELLSGQEWYDRFTKELWHPPKQERIKQDDDGESHDRFFRTDGQWLMYDRVVEAAKKAAGLE